MEKNSFFEEVYEIVKLVPAGKVTTYGAIANCLGTKSGARMVGWAMNNAHSLPDVPAHRVVNRTGLLTGRHHFATPTLMEELLTAEGLTIVDHQIQNFKIHFWDPAIEI
jgi:methylated-DNA-protein-cysteine methyltransferase related protein